MAVATVLLAIGLLAAYFGRRSKPVAVVLGALVLTFVVLAAMFVLADWFTGNGIDQAVLYHVTYGLRGAGFPEYSRIMFGAAGLLIVGLAAAITCTILLTRARPHQRALPTSRASVPFALLACALNPASKDLLQLGGVDIEAGAGARHERFDVHYRTPKLGPNPKRLRNFVFIYAEGLERTYFDEARFPGLIQGLRQLELSSTTFTDIVQTSGTSFTIGGIVGSQCGIPLSTASGGNSMSGMSKYLPNAVCLGDLLSARGYHLSYLGGASSSFAGKGKFLSGHGFRDVQGREQLTGKLPDPSYQSGWGLHDDSLLDIAFERFTELSSGTKPFGLFLLTLDTHHPNGHVSKRVAHVSYEDGRVPILNAVAGSDRLLTDFIRRLRESPAGKETLIVLCSDHLALQNGASERLEQGARRNLFMLIDPEKAEGARIDKAGTTLDIGPTVLHALGYRASLGLGRDLLAQEPSLRQELADFKSSLASWKEPLSGFWGLSRLEDLTINAAEKTIEAGGTTILAPALIAFDEELQAQPFFEFHTRQTRLPDYLHRLPMGNPFVWVVDCARARVYADIEGPKDNLCVIAGRKGAPPVLSQQVGASLRVDEEQLRRVLETEPSPEVQAEQTRRLTSAQLPSGMVPLLESMAPGSIFLQPTSDRTYRYIKDYAALPDVASKGIVWTTSMPEAGEFYFAAPSLRAVRKSRRFAVRRLPLGDDIVTFLNLHADDTVILSLKGDMRALSQTTIEYFATRGIALANRSRSASFAAVLKGNAAIAAAIADDAPVVIASEALRELGIERVESAGRQFGNRSKIIVNGKDLSQNRRGLNIVVASADGRHKAFNIDTHGTENLGSDVFKATPKR